MKRKIFVITTLLFLSVGLMSIPTKADAKRKKVIATTTNFYNSSLEVEPTKKGPRFYHWIYKSVTRMYEDGTTSSYVKVYRKKYVKPYEGLTE